MIIDIITDKNRSFFTGNDGYKILAIPIHVSGSIKRLGKNTEGEIEFAINVRWIIKTDKIPQSVYDLVEKNNIIRKSVYDNIIDKVKDDEFITDLNFEFMICADFIDTTRYINGKQYFFLTQLGNIKRGTIENDRYIRSDGELFLLSTVLIIE